MTRRVDETTAGTSARTPTLPTAAVPPSMRVAVVVGASLALAGSQLPWAGRAAFAIAGLNGPGLVAAAAGLVGLVAGWRAGLGHRRAAAVAAIAGAVATLGALGHLLVSLVDEQPVGVGAWVTLAGGALLTVGAIRIGFLVGEGRTVTGWMFSLPGFSLLVVFLIAPFVLAVWLSMTNQRLLSPQATRFTGFDNYRAILTDSLFWKSFFNNVWFVLLVVPLQTALALWLAVLVNRRIPGRVFFRTVYFLPVVTVMAAASVIWVLLYNPNGLINAAMETITFGAFAPDWLNDTRWALVAIAVVSIWQGVGFQMVILLAALQDVPEVLYEAAGVDGATRWQQFRFVTVPGIRNGLIFVITVTTILAFRLFDQVNLMPRTPGGPLHATRTMLLHMVETGLRGPQLVGVGAAVAVVFFLIVLLLTLAQRRFIREGDRR